MRELVKKTKVLTLLCLLISITSFAREKLSVVVKNCKAGQLEELIIKKGYDISGIKRLTVKGQIDIQDILFIKDMERLKELDLANAIIIKGKYTLPIEGGFERISDANVLSFGRSVISAFPGETKEMKSLESIVLPEKLEKLSDGVFSGYTEGYGFLAGEIRLPRTLKYIGTGVFAQTGISYKAPLPKLLEYIGSGIMLAKGTLLLPPNLTFLNVAEFQCLNNTDFALSDKNANYTVVDGVLFCKDKTVLVLYPKGRKGIYVVPSFVRKIGDNAFWGCEELLEIELNKELEFVGESAFVLCEKLTKVKLNGNQNVIDQLKNELKRVCRKGEYPKVADIEIE